jgi:hypothetical protein
MHVSEKFGMMHQSMRRIEIGIMNQQHGWKSQVIINLTILIPRSEKIRIITKNDKYQGGHRCKNHNGN